METRKSQTADSKSRASADAEVCADSRNRLPRTARVRKQREFDRVYAGNIYAADEVLVVTACRNGGGNCRLGLSVSKKVGNAVVRNRWKRLIREAFRTQQQKLPAGVDLVVRPRKGAQPVYQNIRRSLPRLAQRIQRQLAGGRS